MTSHDETPDVPTFGSFTPGWLDCAVMAITCRLPANWLGLRLAIGLRRIVTMRLKKGALDVERWNLRMRLHPLDNGCEKRILFTPQMYDWIERRSLAAEIVSVRTAGRKLVFVDIGANVGLYSMFMAEQFGTQAQIVAVEPDPTNFRRLQFNVAANPGLPIRAMALALADEAGELVIVPNYEDRGGTRMRKAAGAPVEGIRVACLPLLDLLIRESIKSIDALKIDVEGSEPAVLVPFFRDAPETLWPRLILIEDSSAEWPVDLFALLATLGYRVIARTRQNVVLRRLTEALLEGAAA